jgi:heme exporter protein B
MLKKILLITNRDLQQYFLRNGFDYGVIFFILISLSIITITGDNNLVSSIWIITILSFIINLNNLFKEDYFDGTISQYLTYNVSAKSIMLSKMIFYYLSTVIPNIMAGMGYYILISESFNLELLISLLVSTIGIAAICTLIGICNVNIKNNGIIYLLIMPLIIPFILLGINFSQGEGAYNLYIIIGLTMIFVPVSCYLGAMLIYEK